MRKVNGSGAEILSRILTHYSDLSADWLLTGQGSMLKGYHPTQYIQDYAKREKLFKEIGNTIEVAKKGITMLQAQKTELYRLLH